MRDERYRLLFETSSDAIMLLDRETFFDCNKATLAMFGVTKEEFVRLHPSEISPPMQANGRSSRAEADRMISETYEKGSNKFEWIHRRRNGEDFPCTVWLTRFPLEGRDVLQATVREICHTEEAHLDMEAHRLQLQLLLDRKSEGMERETKERKKAESEVRRLIRAVEGSFNAIALFDTDLRIIYANRAFSELAETSLGNLQGKEIMDFLPQNSVVALEAILASLDPREESRQFDMEVKTAAGKTKWVEVCASTMFTEEGVPESFLAVVNDISDRKAMITALQQSEEKFKTMVEKSVDGIVIIQDGRIVYLNPSMARLSGYTSDEQLGMFFAESLVPDERKKIEQAYRDRMTGKHVPQVYEITLQRKDGTRIPAEVNATVIEYMGKSSDFVYIRDLSDRRKAEKEIREAKDRLDYVLGATGTGFDIIDEDYNVMYVDPNWARSLGDYAGRKCYEYFMGAKRKCSGCAIPQALKTQQKVISEEYLEKEKRHIEVHTIPMKDERGRNIVAEFNLDITERKRMLTALQKSEEMFRNLAENSPNMIFINKAGKVVYANRKCEETMGYTQNEFLSPDFDLLSIIHPEYRNLIRENLGRHFRGEDIPPYEYKLVTKGRKVLDSVINTKAIEFGGEPAILGIVTDVSAMKRTEEELRASQNRLSEILESITDGFVVFDSDLNYTYVNKRGAEMLGKKPEQLIGRNYWEAFPEAKSTPFAEAYEKALKAGEPVTFEDHYAPWDRWFENRIYPTAEGIAIYFTETTERKKAEQILRESEEKYRKLMESANDAIFLADAKTGILIDANKKACEMVGRDRYEIIGMHQSLLHPSGEMKKYERIFRKHVKEGCSPHETFFVQHRDGHRIPVSISSSVFEIGGLLVNQGIFHDLTERIAAEKALRESDEKMRSLFISMEDLVFGFDSEGVFISYQTPEKSLLYTPSEIFLGRKYSEVLPPDIVKHLDKAFKANRKRKTVDFEYPLEVGGTVRWFSAKMSPIFVEEEFNGSVAVVRDITDRIATEKALQASEQVYRSLYESTMALGELGDLARIMEVIAEQARNMLEGVCSTIYIWNPERNVLVPFYSNVKNEKDKFMDYEIPLGTGLTGQVAKAMKGGFANYNDPAAKKGYVPGTGINNDHLQSIIAEPLVSRGELVGAINVIALERVFSEEDLAKLRILAKQTAIAYIHTNNLDNLVKSEERFRKMGESIHDGLMIIENGVAKYINERAAEIYGYSAEELTRMNHLDLVIPEDREQLRHILESFRGTGKIPGEIEFWIQQKDGSRRYIRTRTSTTQDGSKTSQFIITTDITERKLAEDENKRKLMKYMLDDGRIYLVKEFKPAMSLEALNDLLNLDYIGLVISRTPKKDLQRVINGPFEHLWLGEQLAGEELFSKMMSAVEAMKGKAAIMIDRLDYLVFKQGFKETLGFIFRLRDHIYLKEQVAIVSVDTSTLKEDELNIMQKEMSEIELRQVPRPGEELMEIAQLIYDKNNTGIKPSFSEIGDELSLSKPTFRKRVRRLISSGYAVEVIKGNRKVLELTQKGRSLFFK